MTTRNEPTPHRARAVTAFTVAMPVFNEVAILERFHAAVTEASGETEESYEVLYVDDGSRDGTGALLERLAEVDPHVTLVSLSRNFGHAAALSAAIDLASGESLILMDADMQDDPSSIPLLRRAQLEKHADVVFVVRSKRAEPWPLSLLIRFFHWLLARSTGFAVPRDAGSFGLLGPRALRELRKLPERLRYLPGMRAFVGFEQVSLRVPRQRRYDSKSRVGLGGLLRLAGLALFAHSRAPVALFYVLSAVSLLGSASLIAYALISKLTGTAIVSWASTLTAIAFFSGMINLGQAFICEYLSRIYEEIRGRPVYIVDRLRHASKLRDATHHD